jgi:hypothetical protein
MNHIDYQIYLKNYFILNNKQKLICPYCQLPMNYFKGEDYAWRSYECSDSCFNIVFNTYLFSLNMRKDKMLCKIEQTLDYKIYFEIDFYKKPIDYPLMPDASNLEKTIKAIKSYVTNHEFFT